jgi:hypothetical protein
MQFPSDLVVPDNAPWGPDGYPGDTVELQTYTGTLDLTVGTTVQKINTLLWTIDYTYGGTPEPWPDITFDFATPRNISIDAGPAGNLNQNGHLLVNYYNDYLSLLSGSATSFVVQGYQVTVTPLGLSEVGGSNFDGNNPWVQPSRDVMAEFVVTQIPEPATMVLLGLGGLLLRGKK